MELKAFIVIVFFRATEFKMEVHWVERKLEKYAVKHIKMQQLKVQNTQVLICIRAAGLCLFYAIIT